MNLSQDTLQSTGKLLFHKAEEMQQLEKQQQVQIAFPQNLGKTQMKLLLPPQMEQGLFFKVGWSSCVCQTKTSSISLQLTPLAFPKIPGSCAYHSPLCAGSRTCPLPKWALRNPSPTRRKEGQGEGERTRIQSPVLRAQSRAQE